MKARASIFYGDTVLPPKFLGRGSEGDEVLQNTKALFVRLSVRPFIGSPPNLASHRVGGKLKMFLAVFSKQFFKKGTPF